ncbi:hypothetical protein ACI6Q2_16955 [Chitinophagaceae bacterium LWZ2-11]
MIKAYELSSILTKKLHDLKPQDSRIETVISAFADYTRQSACDCNIDVLKKCLNFAEKIYEEGNEEIKETMQLIYMPILTKAMECNCLESKLLKMYLPVLFHSQYITLTYQA